MCTWKWSSPCDLDICLILPLRNIRKKELFYSAPSLFSSPSSPHLISIISCLVGAKAAATSPLHPVPTAVPGRAGSAVGRSRSEAFSLVVICSQPVEHHGAPSVMVLVKRAEVGHCALPTKLTYGCRCHVLGCCLLSVITAVILNIIISLAFSISP